MSEVLAVGARAPARVAAGRRGPPRAAGTVPHDAVFADIKAPRCRKAKASNVRRFTPRAHRPFVLCASAYPYVDECNPCFRQVVRERALTGVRRVGAGRCVRGGAVCQRGALPARRPARGMICQRGALPKCDSMRIECQKQPPCARAPRQKALPCALNAKCNPHAHEEGKIAVYVHAGEVSKAAARGAMKSKSWANAAAASSTNAHGLHF